MTGYIIIDDRDPSISYSSLSWSQAGANPEFQGTTTYTRVQGSNLTFIFSGAVDISVWGTIPIVGDDVAPRSTYQIDNDVSDVFVAVPLPGKIQYNQKFYQSKALGPGTHKLTVTNLINDVSFFIDYLLLTPNSSSTASSSLPFGNSSSVGTPVSSSVSTGPSVTPGSNLNTTAPNITIPTIVGGVLAGLGVLALLVALSLFLKMRREMRKDEDRKNVAQQEQHPEIAPSLNLPASSSMTLNSSTNTNSTVGTLVEPPNRVEQSTRNSLFPPQYTKIRL